MYVVQMHVNMYNYLNSKVHIRGMWGAVKTSLLLRYNAPWGAVVNNGNLIVYFRKTEKKDICMYIYKN